ncbi:ABC transporter permease [Allohahella sp. A8]|uniref:ABC transporter permease n=1 Tax=Allohahella sp. A8 TaxID=3141461 RepID=UPI003A802CE9
MSRNSHTSHSASLIKLWKRALENRYLVVQISRREIAARYKGSMLGTAWAFLTPIIMLAIYTFVFSIVFKARWDTGSSELTPHFALLLFSGLIVHGFFAEIISNSPNLIVSNANFVKKVIFPIDLLSVSSVGTAFYNSAVSVLVLMLAYAVLNGVIHPTSILVVIILLPLGILGVGISWFLSSMGVYVRDLHQAMGLITSALLFLAPVFYPITALPEEHRWLLMINPLTFIIEEFRAVIIWGNMPDWRGLVIYYAIATAVAKVGYYWFQKTRKGFADVL